MNCCGQNLTGVEQLTPVNRLISTHWRVLNNKSKKYIVVYEILWFYCN